MHSTIPGSFASRYKWVDEGNAICVLAAFKARAAVEVRAVVVERVSVGCAASGHAGGFLARGSARATAERALDLFLRGVRRQAEDWALEEKSILLYFRVL